jgi:hypothetical protein
MFNSSLNVFIYNLIKDAVFFLRLHRIQILQLLMKDELEGSGRDTFQALLFTSCCVLWFCETLAVNIADISK